MSHADDGTLHAYLDGELTALERAGLETHLAGCPACRARLEEERDLVERAQGLLARAAPPAVSLPPQRRAGGGGIARPLPRWVPLAWAASMLLALGGGWLARGGSQSAESSLAPTTESTVALGDAEQSRSATPAIVVTPESPTAAPAPVIDGSTGAAYGYRAPAPPRREDVAVQGKVAAEERERDAQVAAQPRTQALADRAANTDTARGAETAGVSAGGAAAPPTGAAQAARPALVVDGIVVGAAPPAEWSTVSLDSARTILQSEPVAIAELPVRSVRARAGVVVIEQPLSSTFTIRLFQRRAESPDAPPRERALARAPALERQARETELLARYVGPLRVEISGPVSTDSLSRLLGLVVPIR